MRVLFKSNHSHSKAFIRVLGILVWIEGRALVSCFKRGSDSLGHRIIDTLKIENMKRWGNDSLRHK